jgi:beta-1,4-mannosyl-glycoprotein beta-1,4-N-acetylglucosaminyltransferase
VLPRGGVYMVYDCFIFFNELELLELRLEELSNVVDKFVLVEATKTFRGKKKPLYFEENKERYSKFLNRIIHIIVDDFPESMNPWVLENYQRNMIMKGLANCRPEDVIIISDVDEIPRPEKILQYKDMEGIRVFEQSLFYYFLNYVAEVNGRKYHWLGPVMTIYRDVITPQDLRELCMKLHGIFEAKLILRIYRRMWLLINRVLKRRHIVIVEDGGWHFSYLGGVNSIVEKIEAFAHSEYDTNEFKELTRIKEAIDSGKDIFKRNVKFKSVKVDETFPRYVINNIDRFSSFIKM